MLIAAIAFIAGAGLVFGLAELPSWAVLAGIAAAGAGALAVGQRAIGWLAAGFLLASIHAHLALTGDWPCRRDREQVEVTGHVSSPAEIRPGRVDFDLTTAADTRALGVPSRLRLSWYEPPSVPRPGETWRLGVRLRCRSGLANPGAFDRELDLLRKGYGATGYVSGSPVPTRLAAGGFEATIDAARAWIAGRIAEATAQTGSTGVLQGLAVGLRGNIAPELSDAFVATGTAHLIAISGMHVTAFALTSLLLLRWSYRALAGARLSAAWPACQALTVLCMTVGYGLLAGASLPTVRTVAMVGIAVGLRWARRNAATADILGLAAMLLVAADPLAVTSAGFWLSFAAVAALLALSDLRGGLWRALGSFARAQAAVTVVLTPVLVASFGAVPVLGPVVNALAIPLFSFAILPATLAGTALLPLAPGIADWVWAALGTALDRCWPALLAAADSPWAVFSPPAAPAWLLASSLVAALATIVVPGRHIKLVAGVLLATLLFRPPPAPVPGAYELTVLDVGHGLAVAVRTASHVLVFDTGPSWRGGAAVARVTLVPFLRSLGIRRIDLLMVSHGDADHAGGLAELRRAFTVSELRGGIELAESAGVGRCRAGDAWNWDAVRFTVIHPSPEHRLRGNDGSCALRVDGAGGAVLLLADPESSAEAAMLERTLAAEIVLVPHHGSASSSSAALVAAIGARLALVSAGYGNRWGFPRPEIVERWQRSGARVLTTAEGGAISVEVTPGAGVGPARPWRLERPRWWQRQ
jgi:competence protein ComEC